MEYIIRFPYVENTENFKTNEISSDDYIKMLHDAYDGTFGNDFLGPKTDNRDFLDRKYGITDVKQYEKNEDTSFYDIKCYIKDIHGNNIDVNTVTLDKDSENMTIYTVKFNDINTDIETELKFWINDSVRINKNEKLSEKDKIKMLPERNLKLVIDGNEFSLLSCKIVYFEEPFNASILIKKITK